MLDNGYWEDLKEYYENDYNGVVPSDEAKEYAQEMIDGQASILSFDERPFDPYDIGKWIEDEEYDIQNSQDFDPDEPLNIFPHLFSYNQFKDEIAAFFLLRDLKKFKTEVSKENQKFIDEAIRLNWFDMMENIPSVKDIFIF